MHPQTLEYNEKQEPSPTERAAGETEIVRTVRNLGAS